MADVLRLSDNSIHTIFDLRDLLELIDERLGDEPGRWLMDYLSEQEDTEGYAEDLEKELDEVWSHHKEVMATLRTQSETIARLIREKEIDRKALSAAAGVIGTTTWREMNV